MKTISYPALFHREGEGYWVSFPDIPECLTQGETMIHAREMATEALELAMQDIINNNELAPSPTPAKDISVEDGSTLVYIDFKLEK